MKKSYVIDSKQNQMRIDRWVRNNLGNMAQGFIEKSLRNGKIKINKKKVKSSTKVKTNDLIDLFDLNYKNVDQNSNKIELKKLKTKLILFFYPKDNTQGCTKEAISFSQNKETLNNLGYYIYGISKDSVQKHINFIQKHIKILTI